MVIKPRGAFLGVWHMNIETLHKNRTDSGIPLVVIFSYDRVLYLTKQVILVKNSTQ